MHLQRKGRFNSVSSPAAMLDTSGVFSTPMTFRTNTGRDLVKPARSDLNSPEYTRVIPQTKDIESQFQVVLGKCLFEKAVQIAEESVGDNVSRKPSKQAASTSSCFQARAGIYLGYSGAISPVNLDDRTTFRLQRPTRCSSALIQGSRSFDSYVNKGSVDRFAVAKSRGAIESPNPDIHKCLRRIRSASEQTLNDFSLRADFTDKFQEADRERYWRRKREEKIAEEEERQRKQKEKAEMMVILEEMKKEYEERKAKEALELQLRLEAERIAKEKEEQVSTQVEDAQNQNIDETTSLVSSSSKNSKRKSRKGQGSAEKSSKKGPSLAKRRTRKQSRVASATGDDEGGKEKMTILKSNRGRSNTGAGEDGSSTGRKNKRVTFPEKLQSTKTFKPNKPVSPRKGSPRRPFPGSSSPPPPAFESHSSPTPGEKRRLSGRPRGNSGTVKGRTRKKVIKKQTTVEPTPPPELPKEPESAVLDSVPPEPVVEPEPGLQPPEVPEIVTVDKPPEFCPANEFKTRRQKVEEWLFYRSGSASCRVNPPILI